MAYIIEQRYLFYSTNNEIFMGDVVDVSHETIWLTNVSSAKFHRGTSMHSIPLDMIASSFQLSELEKGKQYKFLKHDDTTFVSEFDSISNNSHGETLRLVVNGSNHSMPLLFIKNIEST